jgi:dATP/dGTP diphosphohydrolase
MKQPIILTAADSISSAQFPDQFFSVPNDRVGTELRPGEGIMRGDAIGAERPTIAELKLMEAADKLFAPVVKSALTYDDGKPPLATLPWKALREVALVQAYGAKKYHAYNWKDGMEATRNASCAIRHIADYLDGRDEDAESKRHALGHAACRILFLLENIIEGTVKDDRYKK